MRDKHDINIDGSYNPKKYEALQKQRYLESGIRFKEEQLALGSNDLKATANGYKTLIELSTLKLS